MSISVSSQINQGPEPGPILNPTIGIQFTSANPKIEAPQEQKVDSVKSGSLANKVASMQNPQHTRFVRSTASPRVATLADLLQSSASDIQKYLSAHPLAKEHNNALYQYLTGDLSISEYIRKASYIEFIDETSRMRADDIGSGSEMEEHHYEQHLAGLETQWSKILEQGNTAIPPMELLRVVTFLMLKQREAEHDKDSNLIAQLNTLLQATVSQIRTNHLLATSSKGD